ncbi:GNAT family N-acetyltransferase [Mycolicibacterium mucogenicum]|uniref:GNAT family N-acetyltransferase n=1 Tax=Mycolicibacterium mucogenicum TaxID=56689 RepID=UPI000769D4A0|nr:GNAT family N-acetyltransferase [Mycolicibacterium mucogenicum]
MATVSTTDKTGAPTTVTAEDGRFTIAVEGKTVGLIDYIDRDGRRIFPHTEVQPEYGGRGLAIVPACSMVSGYIDKHPEYAPLVDPA